MQGITQITPLYTKVEGLSGGARPIVWDMRIATSSIPRDMLEQRPLHVREAGRLKAGCRSCGCTSQASATATPATSSSKFSKTFPNARILQQDVKQLRQLGAKLILKEIQLRADAGQHQLARKLLAQFPSEGVAGETLQQVRELLDQVRGRGRSPQRQCSTSSTSNVAKIADENGRALAEEFVKEITAEANEEPSPGWPRSSGSSTTRP